MTRLNELKILWMGRATKEARCGYLFFDLLMLKLQYGKSGRGRNRKNQKACARL